MSTSFQSKVLSISGNYAVVKLDHRKFPGILMQLDTLFVLIQEAEEACEAAQGNDEAREAISRLVSKLKGVELFYKQTMKENGLEMPY